MIISELCIDKHKQNNVTKKNSWQLRPDGICYANPGQQCRVPATKTLVMYACGYSHVAKSNEAFHHNIKVVAVHTNTINV